MRELHLNGYIDEEVWLGDEITPDSLHEALYGAENQFADDVHIRLNSYGGSCNAAVQMHDDLRAYPGEVRITVSGTAASAATVLAMAADHLEMTPGSLWMIHDPSVIAWGNERDLAEAIGLLRACKESILNIYAARSKAARDDLAAVEPRELGVGGREEAPDVAEGVGGEQGVGEGVQQHVAVGVRVGAARAVRHADAAHHQRAPGHEAVRVLTVAYPVLT